MSEAPERIWINGTPGVVCGEFDVEKFDGSVEYVRADLLAEAERKLAKAMRHVMDYSNDPHLVHYARATLAELTGGKDE